MAHSLNMIGDAPTVCGRIGLRDDLRATTQPMHDRLDRRVANLDLAKRADYARFLAFHYIALRAIYPAIADFARTQLGVVPPPHLQMLERDLAAMGHNIAGLPALDCPQGINPVGATYVVAGSRLGLAAMVKGASFACANDHENSFVTDRDGLKLWQALLRWMDGHSHNVAEREHIRMGAIATFGLFETALSLITQG